MKNSHICITLLMTLIILAGVSSGGVWFVEDVENQDDNGQFPSMAIDENGFHHICYQIGYPDSVVKYVKQTNDTWSMPITIDTKSELHGRPSLVVDSNGYPHVIYYKTDLMDLRYACWNGSGWNTHILQNVNEGSCSYSIALDTNSQLHVAYLDLNESLVYANWTGISWNIVHFNTNSGGGPSIVIDSNNFPRILYYDRQNFVLIYIKWTGTNWTNEEVPDTNYAGSPAIAIDSNDYVSVLCKGANATLKYGQETESGWSWENVAEGDRYYTMCIDNNDCVHIAYVQNGDIVKYAKWNHIDWVVEVVQEDVGLGQPMTICVFNNEPNICYTDWSDDYLYGHRRGKWIKISRPVEYHESYTSIEIYKPSHIQIYNIKEINYLKIDGYLLYSNNQTGGHGFDINVKCNGSNTNLTTRTYRGYFHATVPLPEVPGFYNINFTVVNTNISNSIGIIVIDDEESGNNLCTLFIILMIVIACVGLGIKSLKTDI